MSLNYLFIFLAIIQLTPFQSCMIAALSVAAQCRIRRFSGLAVTQCLFNIANSIYSTACANAFYYLLTSSGTPVPVAMVFAATAYFLCNTVPVAMVVAWSQGANAIELWKKEFRWFLPFYLVGAALAIAADLLSAHFGWATAALLLPVAYTLYRAYNAQVEQWEERRSHLEETEALHLRTIEGLAMAIEAKDHNTHEHLFRVRDYVTDIAGTMGLGEDEKKALQIAAFLHDIGKLAVPEHIINKPGKLTPDEFEKMKIHPVVGADILERVRFPYPVVPIVRSHHERWDGKGYPEGLRGEDIPLGARILSVVDCFDALASDRPYRKAMPLEKAMEIVKSSAGTQFDPMVVQILEQRYMDLERSMSGRDNFVALNLDVDVQRCDAPGAGFAVGSAEHASGENEGTSTSIHCLKLIAAANHEAQTLFEMSQAIGSSLSLGETAWTMSSRLRALVPFACFALYLKDTETVTCHYLSDEYTGAFRKEPIPLGEGISGWAAQSGLPILNGNATVEPTYCGTGEAATTLLSAVAVPLFDLQEGILGVLTLYASEADAFTRDHLRILQAVESKFSLAVQNALRFQHAESDSGTDYLTRLPNARSIFQRIDGEVNRCRRMGSELSVLVFDLDFFSRINDLEGHLAGNNLLQALATELQLRCRSYDTAARVGGDEFVVLLPDARPDLPQADPQWLRATLSAATFRAGMQRELSASMGVAQFPHDGDTAEELLAMANRRMYLQKRQNHRQEATRMAEIV